MISTGSNAWGGEMGLGLNTKHHCHSSIPPLVVLELEFLIAPLDIAFLDFDTKGLDV